MVDVNELSPDELRGTLILLAKHYPDLFGHMTLLDFIRQFFELPYFRMSEEFQIAMDQIMHRLNYYPVLTPFEDSPEESYLRYG
jgi:hypothetical protein